MKPFFVYMLRCADGTFYVGHTDDLDVRLAQHHAGVHPGYTSTRRPLELAFCEELASRDEARALERKLKGWSSAKKQALIRRDWARIRALSR